MRIELGPQHGRLSPADLFARVAGDDADRPFAFRRDRARRELELQLCIIPENGDHDGRAEVVGDDLLQGLERADFHAVKFEEDVSWLEARQARRRAFGDLADEDSFEIWRG